MPIIKSAMKAARQSLKHRKVNRNKRSLLTKEITRIKKGKSDNLSKLFSLADRAAKTGAIHPRKAARLKGRLSRLLNKKPSSTS